MTSPASASPADRSSRRNFLATAGALAAVAAVPAALRGVPLAPPNKESPDASVPKGGAKKVGFAIMGLGKLALEEILPAFGKCENAKPVALISGHPEKAKQVAAFYGIDPAAIYSYEEIDKIKDNPNVGVVYNVLPNHLHAEYTIKALKAGKDVLCEKPMTGPGQTDQARAMIRAAKDAERRLMIAYRLRYEPFNTKCVEILRSGQLGTIQTIEAHNLQTTTAPNIRLSKATGGGPLGDVGIYCLQATRYLSGEEPVEVSAMQHQPTDDPRFAEVPATVTWLTRFPSGALATCSCGFAAQESRAFKAVCTNGAVELMNAFGYRGQELYVTKGKERSRVDVTPADHFKAEMDAFSRAILEGKPHQTPGEEGLRDMIILDKIAEAARSGSRVKIGDLPA